MCSQKVSEVGAETSFAKQDFFYARIPPLNHGNVEASLQRWIWRPILPLQLPTSPPTRLKIRTMFGFPTARGIKLWFSHQAEVFSNVNISLWHTPWQRRRPRLQSLHIISPMAVPPATLNTASCLCWKSRRELIWLGNPFIIHHCCCFLYRC